MRFVAGIQARMGSERLPGKVLFPLDGKPVLQWVVDAAAQMDVDHTVVLSDDGSDVVRRSIDEMTVLFGKDVAVSERFIKYGELYEPEPTIDYYVRLCGDQPFVDPERANALIAKARETNADYVGYLVDGRPSALAAYGIYAEVVKVDALHRAEPSDHVTNTVYMRPDRFRCEWIVADPTSKALAYDDGEAFDYHTSRWSLTIDTVLDYYRIKAWHDAGGWPRDPGGDPFKNDQRYSWL